MKVQAVALLIQSLCPEYKLGCPTKATAVAIAPLLLSEARAAGQAPSLVVGVMGYESRYDKNALGVLGEVGLMQVKPTGMAQHYCQDLMSNLWDPATNIRCGLRLFAKARRTCGKASSSSDWLGLYNGVRKCGPSRYARCVLDFLAGKPRCTS